MYMDNILDDTFENEHSEEEMMDEIIFQVMESIGIDFK